MTRTVVDTSALLALLYPDDEHNERAAEQLRGASRDGALVINSTIYAELAADETFATGSDLDAFLSDIGVRVESPSRDALFAAGDAFDTYLSRRGDGLQCSECGAKTTHECPSCGAPVTTRQHIAADFIIGAQADHDADGILTFDDGFYRNYFDLDPTTIRQ